MCSWRCALRAIPPGGRRCPRRSRPTRPESILTGPASGRWRNSSPGRCADRSEGPGASGLGFRLACCYKKCRMDNAPRAPAPHAAPPSTKTQIFATVIGNALEWYDFTIYGTFAVTISHLFFPPGSDLVALLSTLAIFGVAYVLRPV